MNVPPIPENGLAEVLRVWLGRGHLYEGLAAALDETDERVWTAQQLRARAARVLFEQIIPLINELPSRVSTWLDVLPAVRSHHVTTSEAPGSSIDWVTTRIRYGWVPGTFVGRGSSRSTDILLATALKWTIVHLSTVREGATQSYPEVDMPVRSQLDVATRLSAMAPLINVHAIRPSRHDLEALARSGRPWGTVARLAAALMVLDDLPDKLIRALLMPDDEIRWRLFHLGVLGVLLQALRDRGCEIVSLRPLGASNIGPAFRVSERSGKAWSLWFEAAGIWAAAGKRSPYAEATAGMALKDRSLGADLLLISDKGEAFVVECKYSSNPEFVARAGYYQAVGYATELASRLCTNVMAVVVGPEGVVKSPSMTVLTVGQVGTCSPADIGEYLDNFFAGLVGA